MKVRSVVREEEKVTFIDFISWFVSHVSFFQFPTISNSNMWSPSTIVVLSLKKFPSRYLVLGLQDRVWRHPGTGKTRSREVDILFRELVD